MEAEVAIKLPQTKECQPRLRLWKLNQKLEEARKDPPLEMPGGAWPYQHLDFKFWPPEL